MQVSLSKGMSFNINDDNNSVFKNGQPIGKIIDYDPITGISTISIKKEDYDMELDITEKGLFNSFSNLS